MNDRYDRLRCGPRHITCWGCGQPIRNYPCPICGKRGPDRLIAEVRAELPELVP